MAGDSIHAEFIRDNIADAQERPSYDNWPGGIVRQYSRLGMASPVLSSGIIGLNSLGFHAKMKVTSGRSGMVCMYLHGQPPPKGPSTALILRGFCGPAS